MSQTQQTKTQMIGTSPKIKALLDLIKKVASSKTNILINGESGTGKELVAKLIHELSPIAKGPFIAVNCGAIPENLIESEMFGHKRGSFTGAVSDKVGLFEAAEGGTLFLDEVGELPLSMQVKLLRAIQERVIRRVGGNDNIKIDVRLISATNRNLEDMIAKSTFREDLYYRLNVINVATPSLRDRKTDIPQLADFFMIKTSAKQHKSDVRFSESIREKLLDYPWPGNVRELENSVERMVTLTSSNSEITDDCLPELIQNYFASRQNNKGSPDIRFTVSSKTFPIQVSMPDFSKSSYSIQKTIDDIEVKLFLAGLEYFEGSVKKAASFFGYSPKTMKMKMAKVGIEVADPEGK